MRGLLTFSLEEIILTIYFIDKNVEIGSPTHRSNMVFRNRDIGISDPLYQGPHSDLIQATLSRGLVGSVDQSFVGPDDRSR